MTIKIGFFSFSIILLLALLGESFAVQAFAEDRNGPADNQIHLVTTSDQGTFKVEINWTSSDIGKENTFDIGFFDSNTSQQLEMVKYDIELLKDGKEIDGALRINQTATEQKYVFSEPGPYTIRIDNIEDLGEGASFPMQVTPEFPTSAILAITASAISIVLATRWSSFRH
jgi:hypothetical protein